MNPCSHIPINIISFLLFFLFLFLLFKNIVFTSRIKDINLIYFYFEFKKKHHLLTLPDFIILSIKFLSVITDLAIG